MIITIEGPTGAGKSAIAIELAEALDTEIISCDSRQIYRYLNIGTAKVDAASQLRIKHHLIDIINPDQSYNAGRFAADAARIIQELESRGKTPILCGGTGLYIRSLLQGLFEHPEIDPAIREKLRQRLHTEGIASLYAELLKIDPSFASGISSNDSQRVLRGLEIYYGTHKTLSEHWAAQNKTNRFQAYRILIAPPRDTLYQRINTRLAEMLSEGLVDEIHSVLNQGYRWTDPGLNSLGYKEFRAHFETGKSKEQCSLLAAQHHRNYAKRQMTWYRKVTFDLTCDSSCLSLSDVLKAVQPDY